MPLRKTKTSEIIVFVDKWKKIRNYKRLFQMSNESCNWYSLNTKKEKKRKKKLVLTCYIINVQRQEDENQTQTRPRHENSRGSVQTTSLSSQS